MTKIPQIHLGTFRSILKQGNINADDFLKLFKK